MRTDRIQPRFVEFIPEHLDDAVLYISKRFRTCSHKCCCGCGEEVVTPLSPAEWRLTCEGDLVSLWPSVGNWDYACRSHYNIQRNHIRWGLTMSSKQIAKVQRRDSDDLARMMSVSNAAKAERKGTDTTLPIPRRAPVLPDETPAALGNNTPGWLAKLLRVLFGY